MNLEELDQRSSWWLDWFVSLIFMGRCFDKYLSFVALKWREMPLPEALVEAMLSICFCFDFAVNPWYNWTWAIFSLGVTTTTAIGHGGKCWWHGGQAIAQFFGFALGRRIERPFSPPILSPRPWIHFINFLGLQFWWQSYMFIRMGKKCVISHWRAISIMLIAKPALVTVG